MTKICPICGCKISDEENFCDECDEGLHRKLSGVEIFQKKISGFFSGRKTKISRRKISRFIRKVKKITYYCLIFIGISSIILIPILGHSTANDDQTNSYNTPAVTQSKSYNNPISIPTEEARVVQTNTNFGSLSSPSLDSVALEKRIHALINQQRNSNGLSSLSFDSSLAVIARGHSQDMAKNNYFSHVNLQGLSPADRGNQQGYTCRKDYGSYYTYGISENIFETSHWTTYNGIRVNDFEPLENIAQKTVDGWMNSLGHRKNILTTTYDREGIGVGIASDCTVYITENFC